MITISSKTKLTAIVIVALLAFCCAILAGSYVIHKIHLWSFTEKDWELYKLKNLVSKIENPKSVDLNYFAGFLKEKNYRIKLIAAKGVAKFINEEAQSEFIEVLESENESDNESNFSLLWFSAYTLAKKYPGTKTTDTFKKMIYSLPDTSYRYFLGCFYLYLITGQDDFLLEIDRVITESDDTANAKYCRWLQDIGHESLIPVIKKNCEWENNEDEDTAIQNVKHKHKQLWTNVKSGIE